MRKATLVGINEVVITVTRPSFLFVTFGLPLISALILAFFVIINRSTPENPVPLGVLVGDQNYEPADIEMEGLVDESGLITSIPESVPKGNLIAFQDQQTAKSELIAGNIKGYYLIPVDYLKTGNIVYYTPDADLITVPEERELVEWVVRVNLVGGDIDLANRIFSPLNLQITMLEPGLEKDLSNPLTLLLPYGITLLYYIIILTSSSLLLSSVTREKESGLIEVLMFSTTSNQLLAGKIVGLGIVGLFQTVIWIGTSYSLLRLSGRTFDLPDSFVLQPSFLVWGIVFFILGYAIYASLMAALGALVPNLREATQATLFIISPMIVPMLLMSIIVKEPDGWLAVSLSLFPLTAPVTMMTRLSAMYVPWWQIFLSVVILCVSAFLIIRAVAGMFRAQTLLSGKPFHVKLLFDALREQM